MAGSVVALGFLGDGQTAVVASLTVSVPAGAAIGDRVIAFVDSSDSGLTFDATTLSTWTVLDGPRANGTSAATAVLERVLTVAGAQNLGISWSSSTARAGGEWISLRGTAGASIVPAPTIDTAATGNFVVPTQAGVAAGAVQIASTLRRRSGASAVNTSTPGYTGFTSGTASDFGTAYGSGANVFGSAGYILSSAGGTVGGETFVSGGVTSLGATYLVVVPTGPPALTGPLDVAGAGSLTLGGVPQAAGSLAVSGAGSLALGGKPGGRGSLAVTGAGSLNFATNVGVGSLAVTGAGSLALGASLVKTAGSLAVAGAGTLALSPIPRLAGTLARTGDGTVTFTGIISGRVKKWNGSAWVGAVVQKWNGSAWVPATLKTWNGSSWA